MKTKKVGTKWGIKRFVAWMLIFMMVVSLTPQGYLSANAAEVSEAEEVSDELEADEASGEEADTEEDEESQDMADEADEASEEAVDEEDAVSDDAAESELEEEAAAEEEIEEPAEEVLEETEEGVEEEVETEEESTEVEAEEETAEEEVAEEETEEAVSEEELVEEGAAEEAAEVVTEEANALNAGEYTVVFDANGGSFDGGITTNTITVGKDEKICLSDYSKPTRDKYLLVGWGWGDTGDWYYDLDEYITPSDEPYAGSGTLTLYAEWRAGATLNANGGRFSDGQTVIANAYSERLEYVYLGEYSNKVSRSGYKLLGWSKNANTRTPEYNA